MNDPSTTDNVFDVATTGQTTCCPKCNTNNGFYDYCNNINCHCHHEELKHLAKDEIKHDQLARPEGNNSGRYTEIGWIKTYSEYTLIDKIIYPVNVCPHCKSNATYHRRLQQHEEVGINIWRTAEDVVDSGRVYKKFDFCLDCHKEFVMEIYIYKTTRKGN